MLWAHSSNVQRSTLNANVGSKVDNGGGYPDAAIPTPEHMPLHVWQHTSDIPLFTCLGTMFIFAKAVDGQDESSSWPTGYLTDHVSHDRFSIIGGVLIRTPCKRPRIGSIRCLDFWFSRPASQKFKQRIGVRFVTFFFRPCSWKIHWSLRHTSGLVLRALKKV